MVLWEITLATAYFLGLRKTYRLALQIQRRLLRARPATRQFVGGRTRAIFRTALHVVHEIQRRDIDMGRNVGNRLLRFLDRMKPSAHIRGEHPPHSEHGSGPAAAAGAAGAVAQEGRAVQALRRSGVETASAAGGAGSGQVAAAEQGGGGAGTAAGPRLSEGRAPFTGRGRVSEITASQFSTFARALDHPREPIGHPLSAGRASASPWGLQGGAVRLGFAAGAMPLPGVRVGNPGGVRTWHSGGRGLGLIREDIARLIAA